jgi:DNA-binding transcriptional LysR family regulator
MDKFKHIQVFCRAVELGTFTAVAKEQNLSAMMISKYIAQLEKSLSVGLLNRTTRKLSLTEAGKSFYYRSKQLLEDLDELEESTSELGQKVKGLLNMSVSIDFGSLYMVSAIDAYQRLFPDVKVLMVLENGVVDLNDGRIDLTIRVTDFLKPGLVARKICNTHLGLYVAPSYIVEKGQPERLEALNEHRCLHYKDTPHRDNWHFKREGKSVKIKPDWHFASNNGRVLCQAAAEGMGIVQAPDLSVKHYLKSGELIEILPETRLKSDALAVYAIFLQRRFLPAKLTTFINFLITHFNDLENVKSIAS